MNELEENLCNLVCWTLNSATNEKLSKFLIKDFVLWKWTERNGKYKGCHFWSEKALTHFPIHGESGLQHDHVIPRSVLFEELKKLKTPNNKIGKEEIYQFLNKKCIGCVLVKDEHVFFAKDELTSSMPKDWDRIDPWARYRKIKKIKVWKVNSDLKKTKAAY